MCSKKFIFRAVGIFSFGICGLLLLIYFCSENNLHSADQNLENEFVSHSLKQRHHLSSYTEEWTSSDSGNKQFKSLSEHGPNLILQYGIARTATTLQFQILCLMMAFLHEDEVQFVGCSHHKQKEKKYNVIKTHVISEFLNTNLPSNTWIFMTSNSSFSENKKASVNRNIQKIEAKNLRIPLIADVNSVLERGYLIVYEYQAIFGMPDDKMKHIVEYIQYWDVLRVCCGTQMSAHWRNYLFTRSQHMQNKRLTKPECHLHNIAEVEKNLIETYAFRKFALVIEAIGKLSVVDGKLDGNYCERCNDNIAKKHLKFNEKCT